MGTCHSQLAAEGNAFGDVSKTTARHGGSGGGGGKRLMITIPTPNKSSSSQTKKRIFSGLFSPSERSNSTAPITPASNISTPNHQSDLCGISPMAPLYALPEYEEASSHTSSSVASSSVSSYSRFFKNTKHGTVIKSIISEEDSVGAPSDEEEMDMEKKAAKKLQAMMENGELAFLPSIKANSQDRVKTMKRHVTGPESIIYRPAAPLLAPPRGSVATTSLQKSNKASVSPQTIANFNKLKLQVQLAARAEKMKRHKEKVEDRYQDVKGYRNLWKEYEEIKQRVEETTANKENLPPKTGVEESMALQEPESWFFDFQNIVGCVPDNDENQSVANLSLLSESNMDAQRRFYMEKSRQRRKKKNKRRTKQRGDDSSLHSLDSLSTRKSNARGQAEVNDYGPVKRVTSMTSLSDMGFATEDDDDTPKTRTTLFDASMSSEWELNNDYNVPQRRINRNIPVKESFKTHNDSSLTASANHSFSSLQGGDLNGSGFITSIEYKDTPIEDGMADLPTRIEQYGFDPAAPLSAQMDVFSVPSVQIDDSSAGVVRWRKFDNDSQKEKSNSARRLDFNGLTSEKNVISKKESDTNDKEVPKVPNPMSQKGKGEDVSLNQAALKRKDNKAQLDSKKVKKRSASSELNPFWEMSSEQFMMMSTFSPPPADPAEEESKTLYDSFWNMSTEQFMMMSTFNTPTAEIVESNDCPTRFFAESDSEPSCDVDEVESKGPITQNETCETNSIAHMSSEAFLRVASPERLPSEESPDIEASVSVSESDPTLEAVASQSTVARSPMNDQPETPSNKTSTQKDLTPNTAVNLLDDLDFWDVDSRRLSIDQCDELASQVSGQLSDLLRRFREDNRR